MNLVKEKLKIVEGYGRHKKKELKRQLSTDTVLQSIHRDGHRKDPKDNTHMSNASPEDRKSIKAATRIMEVGHAKALRKAARELSTNHVPITMTTDQIVAKLISLHPRSKKAIPSMPSGNHDGVSVSMKALRDTVAVLCAASAPGPSGFTEELLQAAIMDDQVASIVSIMLRDIQNNKVHSTIREFLTTCRLIAAGKENGGVRPITIGEVMLKVASAVAVQDVSPHLPKHFGGLQLGLMASGGCETVHHEMMNAMREHPDWSTATIDSSNAFNTCYRAEMAKELFAYDWLKPLWQLFELAYRTKSKLLLSADGSTIELVSEDGSRQGCVLGSLLFCLAEQPILNRAQAKFPNVTIRAIIDDISLWGPTDEVVKCFLYLRRELSTIGLITNEKSIILCPEEKYVEDLLLELKAVKTRLEIPALVTVTSKSMKTLGGFHSKDAKLLEELYHKHIEKHDTFFRRIGMMPPNLAYPLLRACGAPRMDYLLKIVPPSVMRNLAEDYDRKVSAIIEHIADADLSVCSREARLLLEIDTKHGGAGLGSTAALSPVAFEATSDVVASKHTGGSPITLDTRRSMMTDKMCAELDALGPVEKAHRKANSVKHSSSALNAYRYGLRFPPAEYSAAFRWKFAIGEGDEADFNLCLGCLKKFSARDFMEHRPGCALFKRVNVSTMHHAVVRAAEATANRSAISSTHEPRHYELAEMKGVRKSHEKGPDTAFDCIPPLAVDWKTLNSASKANCSTKISALAQTKRERCFGLYEDAVRRKGETLACPIILQSGGLLDSATALLHTLTADNPRADFGYECASVVVAQQRALAKILLTHGRRSARMRCAYTCKRDGGVDVEGSVKEDVRGVVFHGLTSPLRADAPEFIPGRGVTPAPPLPSLSPPRL
jgi:hypothetical protein